jgi:hypothetical protein
LRKSGLLTLSVLFVATAADLTEKHVTDHLNWYRIAHDAPQLQSRTLDRAAYDGVQTICSRGFDHHVGTEAEQASLYYVGGPCDSDLEAAQIKALKSWYGECPAYYGQGFASNTGHFTQIVWKGARTYGLWAQTCNIPGLNCESYGGCCAVMLKTDESNILGQFNQNIGNAGRCANVDTPWA